jgi:hypothetical protein
MHQENFEKNHPGQQDRQGGDYRCFNSLVHKKSRRSDLYYTRKLADAAGLRPELSFDVGGDIPEMPVNRSSAGSFITSSTSGFYTTTFTDGVCHGTWDQDWCLAPFLSTLVAV